MKYNNSQIVEIDTVVFSTQHQDNVTQEILQEVIIKPVLSKKWLNRNTKFFINPKGRFVVGGPIGDCGLTGRKIIVETYGGMSREESAFSGKNPSKVDCSAVYTARYIAKNIVAAGLADRCEIQLSYSIGVAETISIMIDTFRTEKISNHALIILTKNIFDLRSDNLIKMLNLLQPIYLKTAAYRHFVRAEFPWEKIDKANEFAQ